MEKKVIPCFWNPWVGVLWLWIKFLDGVSLETTCPIAKHSFWQGHLGAFSSGTLFSFDTDCLFYYGHSGYTSSTQSCAVPQGCWDIGTWGEEDGEWRVEIVPVTSRCFFSWRLPIAVYVLLDWEAWLLASFLPSSGLEQGFCMMCTMEMYLEEVLSHSSSAIKPTCVIRELPCK